MNRKAALALPDQLLVRYFRGGELDRVKKVIVTEARVEVRLTVAGAPRIDLWRDLGGGLGFVPDPAGD